MNPLESLRALFRGLGFRVQGLGFRVQGLGLEIGLGIFRELRADFSRAPPPPIATSAMARLLRATLLLSLLLGAAAHAGALLQKSNIHRCRV